jgi:hypothetical protein
MARRSSQSVKIGDHFMKADDNFGTVWEVVQLSKTNDGLVHATIVGGLRQSETRTISLNTITDRRYFIRGSPPTTS